MGKIIGKLARIFTSRLVGGRVIRYLFPWIFMVNMEEKSTFSIAKPYTLW